MKKILAIAIIGLSLSLISSEIYANCGLCGVGKAVKAAEVGEVETIKGAIVCFGCTLKKEEGAKAQCSIYGHTNAVRTTDGKIWAILENDKSTELINNHDYAGKDIEIKGRKLTEAQAIEIENYNLK